MSAIASPQGPLPPGADPAGPGTDDNPTVRWGEVLAAACRAPSSHNTQPWRVVLSDQHVEVRPDTDRQLAVTDPDGRELLISCGAMVRHLAVAVRAQQLSCRTAWHLGAPGDTRAVVQVTGQARPPDQEWARAFAVDHRTTHRGGFERRPVPPWLVEEAGQPRQPGASVHVVADDARPAVEALVAEGNRVQYADPAFRGELASWTRASARDVRLHADGLAWFALGLSRPATRLFRALLRHADLGRLVAAADRRRLRSASALVALTTAGDRPADWVAAGETLAALLLDLRLVGVSCAYVNQPVQVPALRGRLRALLGGDQVPQILLAVGYPSSRQRRPAPRRAVADLVER